MRTLVDNFWLLSLGAAALFWILLLALSIYALWLAWRERRIRRKIRGYEEAARRAIEDFDHRYTNQRRKP